MCKQATRRNTLLTKLFDSKIISMFFIFVDLSVRRKFFDSE